METLYSKEHEWIAIEGNIGTIGITDYAAHQLGDITFVELPKVGKQIVQNNVFCTIESVKAASDIYAPLSGKITEVNKELDNAPQTVNEQAESGGWIAKIEISDLSGKSTLMNKAEYDQYIQGL